MTKVVNILLKYDQNTFTKSGIIYSNGNPSIMDLYLITLLGYVYVGESRWLKYTEN